MSLKEKLLDDLKQAMKDRDVIRKNTVQMMRAAILQIEKDDKVTLDDDGVLEVIAKELKMRKDVLPEYEKSGRQDLVDGLNAEIQVLLAYLPEQLTPEQLTEIVKEAIESVGATSMKDMGKVMGAVMPKVKGKTDGKQINQCVKELLG
ncbi:MAG: GatB/YqeY domain-containing protein [Eubacteriales bacterium]|nr:GatB/YqeY domain-containing protein [Eubacteriales bacterium]